MIGHGGFGNRFTTGRGGGRIVADPPAMTASSLSLRGVADAVSSVAGAIRGSAMPDMPPGMAAEYTAGAESVARQLSQAPDGIAAAADELSVRASAASMAADVNSQITGGVDKVVVAIGTPAAVAVASASAVVPQAQITFTRRGAVAVTASGLRISMPELAPTTFVSGDHPQATPHGKGIPHGSHLPVSGEPARAVQEATLGGGGGFGDGGAPASGGEYGAASALQGDSVDPQQLIGDHGGDADFRATQHDGTGGLLPKAMPHGDAPQQDWACWMGSTAGAAHVPAMLPIAMALARSGLQNMPAGGDDVGFFGLGDHREFAPAGFGLAREAQPDAQWWEANPDAQLDRILNDAAAVGGGDRAAGLTDPEALTRWATDVQPGLDPAEVSAQMDTAKELVSRCAHGDQSSFGPAAPAGGHDAALQIARRELGAHELGSTNTGPEVNRYLASANVAPGNPWCASFVNWSLEHSGHPMPGNGWAAVSTWVSAAENHQNGLSIVSPDQARPGDIVAYDWGGQNDFGADGHIGFLESKVEDGQFTTVEGNAHDAVTRMERNMGEGHVVFLRAGG